MFGISSHLIAALRALAVFTLVAVVLSGCGGATAGPTATPIPTSVPVPSSTPVPTPSAMPPVNTPTTEPTGTPAPEPTTTPAGGTVLITYSRTGGFIGDMSKVVVYADGSADVTSRTLPVGNTTIHISADLWSRIQTAAGAIDWEKLQDHYGLGAPADAFEYEIHYTANGIDKTVSTHDAGGAPDEVMAFIGLLNEVIAEANTVATDPTPGAAQNAALLIYHISGGEGGIDTYVYLTPDGQAYVITRGTQQGGPFTVEPTLWSKIVGAIGGVDWDTLQSTYVDPQSAIADGFIYEFNHFAADHFTSVSAQTGDPMPAGLETLTQLMDQVISQGQQENTGTPTVGKTLLMLDYRSAGGIAFMTRHMIILGDGSVWLNVSRPETHSRGALPADQWAQIQAAVAALDWESLQYEYKPDAVVADGIATSVSYLGTDGHHIVKTSTGAENPPELDNLLNLLRSAITP